MSDLSRRDALKLLGVMAAVPTLSLAGCTSEDAAEVRERAAAQNAGTDDNGLGGTTRPGADYERRFFTDHEYETVKVLADLIIPADARSGSATDAGVPAFIDFVMTDELLGDRTRPQTALRGGLAWLDFESQKRFEAATFLEATGAERRTLLDAIAYPEEAAPEVRAGVVFFNTMRDLVASGFFSSKMGVKDLEYVGNKAHAWNGCPDAVLDYIGVSEQA